MRLVIEQADALGKTMLAQRCRELETGMAGADDDHCLLRRTICTHLACFRFFVAMRSFADRTLLQSSTGIVTTCHLLLNARLTFSIPGSHHNADVLPISSS
jgi:hypothetical protein